MDLYVCQVIAAIQQQIYGQLMPYIFTYQITTFWLLETTSLLKLMMYFIYLFRDTTVFKHRAGLYRIQQSVWVQCACARWLTQTERWENVFIYFSWNKNVFLQPGSTNITESALCVARGYKYDQGAATARNRLVLRGNLYCFINQILNILIFVWKNDKFIYV